MAKKLGTVVNGETVKVVGVPWLKNEKAKKHVKKDTQKAKVDARPANRYGEYPNGEFNFTQHFARDRSESLGICQGNRPGIARNVLGISQGTVQESLGIAWNR